MTKKTQDRIRGVKGSKVLRTRKIPQKINWNSEQIFGHFCSSMVVGMIYALEHWDEFISHYIQGPSALETPITDPVKN